MGTKKSAASAGPPRPASPRKRRAAWPRISPVSRDDAYLFREGTHRELYAKLGAQPRTHGGRSGFCFSVWAPAARRVAVIGDFNRWDARANPLRRVGDSGIWTAFVAGVEPGALYKFRVESRLHDLVVDKADPFAFQGETAPGSASVVWPLDYDWQDETWIEGRAAARIDGAPMSIYEVHAGSWKRSAAEVLPSYRGLAEELIPYLKRMGFTHVELMPLMEHPYYASWGYQTTGYFAPTSRYGSPQDLMFLIDRLHQNGIGVVFDWVPSHFPGDEHGLLLFDGTHLFEHADPRRGFHPDWTSHIFNYERPEVRSFLISSALFWIERYHVDAIRVDAVASMLYRDYSRKEGEWVPNEFGGREDLEAIAFLRQLNDTVHERHPGVLTIAEESTAWPMVSRPTAVGGLGFDLKWDMGWMHDTLHYMSLDPIHRKFHHNALTFRMMYAWSERFLLPLSHDEVVHGKASLLGKMAGDRWQRFANLRALYGYMWTLPGKKLLFMGGELGQWREWDHDVALDWELLDHAPHEGLRRWVADLNRVYRDEPALHAHDIDPAGFEWIDCHDADNSVLCFARRGADDADLLLVICNFTPVPRHNYRVGAPAAGGWSELLNSDAVEYDGSGVGNPGVCVSAPIRFHGQPHSLCLTLPPLSVVVLRRERAEAALPAELIAD